MNGTIPYGCTRRQKSDPASGISGQLTHVEYRRSEVEFNDTCTRACVYSGGGILTTSVLKLTLMIPQQSLRTPVLVPRVQNHTRSLARGEGVLFDTSKRWVQCECIRMRSGFWRTFVLKGEEKREQWGIGDFQQFGLCQGQRTAHAFVHTGHLSVRRQCRCSRMTDIKGHDRGLPAMGRHQRQGRWQCEAEAESEQYDDGFQFHDVTIMGNKSAVNVKL